MCMSPSLHQKIETQEKSKNFVQTRFLWQSYSYNEFLSRNSCNFNISWKWDPSTHILIVLILMLTAKFIHRTIWINLSIPVTREFATASLNLVSIDQLRIYMLYKAVNILDINEIRLDSTVQNGKVGIPRCTPDWKDTKRFGAGVAPYIRDSTQYKRFTYLPEDFMKLISIQLSKPKVKPFIVCTYGFPQVTRDFWKSFPKFLERLFKSCSKKVKKCFL